MDPSHYLEPRYPAYNDLGSLQPHATDLGVEQHRFSNQYPRFPAPHHAPTDCPLCVLPAQYAIPYNPVGTLPFRSDWDQFLTVRPIV